VLVGDWATPPRNGAPGESGDYADSLTVRRGNTYFQAEEVFDAEGQSGYRLEADASFTYGDPGDTAFSAQLDYTYVLNGVPTTL
jgi:hypothetical protein